MEFECDRIYYMDNSGIDAGGLSMERIALVYNDGRHISAIDEQLLDEHFFNLEYIPGNKQHDFLLNGKHKVEARTFASSALKEKRGIRLVPSNMIGAQRTVSIEKYYDKLRTIDGFILICHHPETYTKMLVFFIPSTFLRDPRMHKRVPLQELDEHTINGFLSMNIRRGLKIRELFDELSDEYCTPNEWHEVEDDG
jgi:hypothetical protein